MKLSEATPDAVETYTCGEYNKEVGMTENFSANSMAAWIFQQEFGLE